MVRLHLASESAHTLQPSDTDVPLITLMGGGREARGDTDPEQGVADELVRRPTPCRDHDLRCPRIHPHIAIAIEDAPQPTRNHVGGHLEDPSLERTKGIAEKAIVDERRVTVFQGDGVRALWKDDIEVLRVEMSLGCVSEQNLDRIA